MKLKLWSLNKKGNFSRFKWQGRELGRWFLESIRILSHEPTTWLQCNVSQRGFKPVSFNKCKDWLYGGVLKRQGWKVGWRLGEHAHKKHAGKSISNCVRGGIVNLELKHIAEWMDRAFWCVAKKKTKGNQRICLNRSSRDGWWAKIHSVANGVLQWKNHSKIVILLSGLSSASVNH